MKLSKPKNLTWWIALIVGVLGIIGHFAASAPIIGPYSFWFIAAAFVLMMLATALKGL
jgi:hypothetical protein